MLGLGRTLISKFGVQTAQTFDQGRLILVAISLMFIRDSLLKFCIGRGNCEEAWACDLRREAGSDFDL